MKKYNVYNLYVVKIERDSEGYYLICKYNKSKNLCEEIFTNEKLNVREAVSVKPLATYYSMLGRYDYSTNKPLVLDKKQLLREYVLLNSESFGLMDDNIDDVKLGQNSISNRKSKAKSSPKLAQAKPLFSLAKTYIHDGNGILTELKDESKYIDEEPEVIRIGSKVGLKK